LYILLPVSFLALVSPMTVPAAVQPNIVPGLLNQTHIASNLFDLILQTANNREELERSWTAVERDIVAQEHLEARRRQRRNLL
jgi:hypothetical protein